MSNTNSTFRVIGTRPVRHDGIDKVTGRANYGADFHLPGMLHGKILRSPYAHARIKKIDATRALELEGVEAVVTGMHHPEKTAEVADLEEGANVNYGFYSRNVLAREKALYLGHAIAAVAATSPALAEQALELIDIEYEILTPVLDADSAMKEGAPLVHERLLSLDSPSLRPGGYSSGPLGTTPI